MHADTSSERGRRANTARRNANRTRQKALNELRLLRDVALLGVNENVAAKLEGARRANVTAERRRELVADLEAERRRRLAAVWADYRRKRDTLKASV